MKDLNIYGCGNMSQAIMLGQKKHIVNYHCFTPSFTKADELANKIGGKSYKYIKEMPKDGIHFLACKPQQFDTLANDLDFIDKDSLVVSIMAGISNESIAEKLGVGKVIRLMPNTPSLVGKGVTLLSAMETVSKEELEIIKSLMAAVSSVYTMKDQDELDRITPITGSAPAYIFEIARIYQAYMEEHQINPRIAKQMVIDTIFGSASLMDGSDESFEQLRENVTSKKGITFEVLESLKENKFQKLWNDSLDKGYKRAKELGS